MGTAGKSEARALKQTADADVPAPLHRHRIPVIEDSGRLAGVQGPLVYRPSRRLGNSPAPIPVPSPA